MSDLPASWAWSTVGDVTTVQLGRQRSPKNHTGPHMRPYLRSANVTWNGIDVSDVKEMNFAPEETKTFELVDGDILLNEASGSPGEVGKPAIWRGEIPGACFQNTLLRVRSSGPDEAYLYWYFYASALTGRFGEAGRGVNIRHLGKQGLTSFRIPVPPRPEQRRIVAAIEEHFSRLHAAEASVRNALTRVERFRTSVMQTALRGFSVRTLAELSIGMRYGTSVKCSYEAKGPAVMRIPNVANGKLSLEDVKFATSAVAPSAYAQPGEILFVRTNGSRDLIGRSACIPDGPARAFASYLIGVELDTSQALPSFVNLAMQAPRGRRQLVEAASTTAGQYNLNIGKIGATELPVPDLAEQQSIVDRVDALEAETQRIGIALSTAAQRSAALRRSILAAAFSGQLVDQDPSDKPAAVLLERIAAERKAKSPRKRAATS
jgi:type I restriction enzyme S subunit